MKQYALKQSALEDVMEESVAPAAANDPLNGACQLGRTQPSPFSSRKVMYENEEVDRLLLLLLIFCDHFIVTHILSSSWENGWKCYTLSDN